MAINQLQLPGPLVVPQVDFSMLGNLPEEYRKAQVDRARKAALTDLPRGPDGAPDFNAAISRLAQAGDFEGVRMFSTLANTTAMQRAQINNMNFNQGIETKKIGIAEKAAEEKPNYQVLEDQNGNKRLLKIDPYGKGITDVTPGGAATPNNPFAGNGKMNEAQSKDALYATRMYQANKVLSEPTVSAAGGDWWERAKANLPGAGKFYNPNSADFQKFDQAQRDFINATLRRESGAVINESEFENARKQYFPQPGDSKEVLEQKRRNRIEAIKGVAMGGGQGYRPPFIQEQGGNLVDRPADAPKPQAAAPGAGAPVRVQSKEQRDALPAGTPYVAPDGQVRIKQ